MVERGRAGSEAEAFIKFDNKKEVEVEVEIALHYICINYFLLIYDSKKTIKEHMLYHDNPNDVACSIHFFILSSMI